MSSKQERAILAGGCFWGMQDLIRRYPGVISTRVGYSGGDVRNATYRDHGSHAEAIEIIFDPQKLSFRQLLEYFFQIHDPTTLDRQGNDRGASYRSAIFYTSEEQKCVPPGTSGKPSPSTRTIWSAIRTVIRATSSDLTGSFPPEKSNRHALNSLQLGV